MRIAAASALAGILILALAATKPALAAPAQPEAASSPGAFVLSGKSDYQFHCASCHGLDARGDGPAAVVFKIRPANLTLLSKQNGGVFPAKRVFRVIDGTASVRAHGSREMPVWGRIFERQGSNTYDRAATQREVRERIQRLVNYIKSIQRK